ncbi:MAG: hypothetical protein WD069_17510 [Planctomycetales bacterium]
MTTKSSNLRFSTVADFDLIVNGRSYPVAQVAPKFLILETATAIPPGPATLIIRVDGEEERRTIEIVKASSTSTRVSIVRP